MIASQALIPVVREEASEINRPVRIRLLPNSDVDSIEKFHMSQFNPSLSELRFGCVALALSCFIFSTNMAFRRSFYNAAILGGCGVLILWFMRDFSVTNSASATEFCIFFYIGAIHMAFPLKWKNRVKSVNKDNH